MHKLRNLHKFSLVSTVFLALWCSDLVGQAPPVPPVPVAPPVPVVPVAPPVVVPPAPTPVEPEAKAVISDIVTSEDGTVEPSYTIVIDGSKSTACDYHWLVHPADELHPLIIEPYAGDRAYWSTPTEGDYTFTLFVAKGDKGSVASKTVTVGKRKPPMPPPGPNPPMPPAPPLVVATHLWVVVIDHYTDRTDKDWSNLVADKAYWEKMQTAGHKVRVTLDAESPSAKPYSDYITKLGTPLIIIMDADDNTTSSSKVLYADKAPKTEEGITTIVSRLTGK